MADKDNNRTWEWKLNSSDDDSEFMDIDFSEADGEGYGAADNPSDAGSLLDRFVDDSSERVRASGSVSAPSDDEDDVLDLPLFAVKARKAGEVSAARSAREARNASVKQEEPASYKDNYDKDYMDKKDNSNLRKILFVALALIILIALIFLLVKACSKDPVDPGTTTEAPSAPDDSVWKELDSGSELAQLVYRFFTARRDGNATTMRQVLDTTAVTNAQDLENQARLYEDFTNIKVYEAPGAIEGEHALCVTYDAKFVTVETPAPSLAWLYARPDSTGKQRLMTSVEYVPPKEDDGTTEYQVKQRIYDHLIKQAGDPYIQAVTTQVQTACDAATAKDARLAKTLDNLSKGIPEIPPVEPSSSTVPTQPQPTNPPVIDPTQPSIIVDPTVPTQPPTDPVPTAPPTEFVPLDQVMYVTEDRVNMRTAPDTSQNNVIVSLMTNDQLQVIGESNEWYHVMFGEREGYVYKDYVSPFKAFIEVGEVTMYVNADLVNLRRQPVLDSSNIIREMRLDEALIVVGKNEDNWCKVRSTETESGYAYVKADFLSATPQHPTE